jgi:hypothetical protein|tara:strand:+ start:981 stop:1205 length:225 start_codon:yes stop_codon:yes gene_type:complete
MKDTLNIGNKVQVEGYAAIITGEANDDHAVTVRHFHTGEEFEVDVDLVKPAPSNSNLDAQDAMHRLAHVSPWEL